MRHRFVVGVAFAALWPALAWPLFAHGQDSARARDTVTMRAVEVSLGVVNGGGRGVYSDEGGIAYGVLAAGPLRRTPRGSLMMAGSFLDSRTIPFSQDCLIVIEDATAPCAQPFPSMTTLALLAGWQVSPSDSRAALRVLAGPARVATRRFPAAYGAQLRIDATIPLSRSAGLSVWTHRIDASVRGAGRLHSVGGGIALRLQ